MAVIDKKKKNSEKMTRWGFTAHWVLGQIAAAVVIGIVFFGLLSFSEWIVPSPTITGSIILFIVFYLTMPTLLIAGLAYAQKRALESYTNESFFGWVWAAIIGFIVSVSWVFMFLSLFNAYSPSIPSYAENIVTTLVWSPLIIYPSLVQTWILRRYVHAAFAYALLTLITGLLLTLSFATIWISIMTIVCAVIYVTAQVQTLLYLLNNKAKVSEANLAVA